MHQHAEGSCKSRLCRKGRGTFTEPHKETPGAGPMFSLETREVLSARAGTAAHSERKKRIPMPGSSLNHEIVFLRTENL